MASQYFIVTFSDVVLSNDGDQLAAGVCRFDHDMRWGHGVYTGVIKGDILARFNISLISHVK